MQANHHSQATIHPLHSGAKREAPVFGLGGEEYTVDICLVQELRGDGDCIIPAQLLAA
ncbi:hypothetical protein [Rugamonas rubra]|uniref:CheW-like domain-containing protein n=1 Tax=Rugamonas rubra TaxID=758825 RepID=A0A1I4SKL6_9BURK|nr:hypothetical protein [Rugamonas rubra]SFM65058.1 hypothetical protein SAMN02982985_04837 [Rugamonas rubra]